MAEVVTKATMARDVGPMKIKGKAAETHQVHFFQLAEGKVKQHFLFANDMSMAVQLGMIDPAKLAPPPAVGQPAKQ